MNAALNTPGPVATRWLVAWPGRDVDDIERTATALIAEVLGNRT